MTSELRRIPSGPVEKYNPSQDLLSWLSDQFKKHGNVYKASVYGASVYVVSDPQYADHILRKNWQNYKKGQAIKRIGFLLGNGLMVSEGEFWKSQRRMIQPAFHDRAIGALSGIIREANLVLLNKWKEAAQENLNVNITTDISNMLLNIVLKSIFGDDYQEVELHFRVLSNESARNLKFVQTFRPLGRMVAHVAARRRKYNIMATDMLGMLMEARDQKSGQVMTDNQLVSEIMTLIVAGHETTASTLNWIWYLLSKNPEVETILSSELHAICGDKLPDLSDLPRFTYTRQVIEETLRLYPAGWLMTRRALRDDLLGDYYVPAGTEIYISPFLIQRHRDLWKDPDRFNPDRFAAGQLHDRQELAMLSFSAGPRKCIGELFARIEMQIHLIAIAKELRLRCVEGNSIVLEAGVNLRNKSDFIMIPEIRGPLGVAAVASASGFRADNNSSAICTQKEAGGTRAADVH